MNKRIRFVYPERSILQKARPYQIKAYYLPVVKQVFWHRFRVGFNLVKGNRWGTILEIGCDYGFLLPALCQLGDTVIATDQGKNFSICREITLLDIQNNYSNLVLKPADATKLSEVIPANSCDLIVAFDVLEHIKEYRAAMEEVHKCLKIGGFFLCGLPTETWLYKLGRKIIRSRERHPGYNYAIWRQQLKEIFIERKIKNSPSVIPLFKVGLYQKLERL